MTEQTAQPLDETVDDDRRNFIHIATGAVAFGGVAAFAIAAIDQWNPAADTRAASSLDVDKSKVPLGSEIRVLIGGKPFFLRHRTPAEIAEAEAVNVENLRDPETDDERLRPMQDGKLNRAMLITSGACTHLGLRARRPCPRQYRRVWRLVLPLPRLGIRHVRPHPQRPRPEKPPRFRTTSMCRIPWSTFSL